jgi:phosphatidylglycerol---prolipoprotein diacylglyceryl transferase
MLTWDLDPVLLAGSTPLRYYNLLLAASIVGGFFLWRWQLRRSGRSEALAARFLAYGLIGAIVGARLGHYLLYDLQRLIASPLSLLQLWQGGLASHGAAVGLALALLLFAQRNGLPFADVADRLTFGVALAAVLVRIGNFCNSEIVGRPTDGTWGVRFPRFDLVPLAQVPLRHPSQLYEAGLGLVLLVLLLLVDRHSGERRRRGLLSALLLVVYFGGRIVVERFKQPEGIAAGSALTLGQILSLPPLLLGVVWLVWVLRTPTSPRAA